VAGDYAWLGVMIVIGSMISLGYYLPVIAAMWMRDAPAPAGTPRAGPLPTLAGGSAELDADGVEHSSGVPDAPEAVRRTQPEVLAVALLAGAATVVFGVIPQPLFDLVAHVGSTLGLS
jgi:NADH-quinone oxidoreductase subunit N